jgi:predicted MFS family arabinose efflux permease
VLDRFDRRRALAVSMIGLVLGTAAGGLAQGLPSMVLARVLAGVFGGPATSLALSIVADVVPPERRGRAMGAVMASFSAASVLGLPGSLRLANHFGWRAPFFVVAGLGLLLVFAALAMMPPMRAHLTPEAQAAKRAAAGASLLRRPLVQMSYAAIATTMAGAFSLIPVFAVFFVFNRGYPRDRFDVAYFVGGLVSFAAMRLAGILTDRRSGFASAMIGTVLAAGLVAVTFVRETDLVSVPLFFIGFMSAMSFRNIAFSAVTSKVPAPYERAAFMSGQSVVQHLSSSLGALLGAQLLSSAPDGRLLHVDRLGWAAIALFVFLPLLVRAIERRLPATAAAPVRAAAE